MKTLVMTIMIILFLTVTILAAPYWTNEVQGRRLKYTTQEETPGINYKYLLIKNETEKKWWWMRDPPSSWTVRETIYP
ncbi:unnamed protein product [Ceutorhynchus assimilis]|uniref:Uncharacterized protein n=1 Tax=Ceutorhynchus assimilis TaxID=467358 RepID=A0A9N9M9R2_9CUCU|nr:unnamed protein product [Ceutorhynchus assimilis]